jgi:biopolymer transport protein ExbD
MKSKRDRRHRWRPESGGSGSVNLISMMDILTVLLLFLLKSYVAGGEVMVPAPGVHLPASTADQPPPTSVVVAIDGDEILVGGDHAASLSEALTSGGLEIAPLSARLQAIQQQQDEIARLRGAQAAPAARTVTIQGDRDIQFQVLQKVMYTLGQNGYENISLAVLQKS